MMHKDKMLEKILRVYPLLDPERKRKALVWLKKNGYSPNLIPPNKQTYKVKSPPGPGRILRIPMFLENLGTSGEGLGYYNTSVITDGGAGAAAVDNSVAMVSIPAATNAVLNQYNSSVSTDTTFGHFTIKSLTFSTRQVPWAVMRVVGLETVINYVPSSPALPRAGDVGENTALGVGLACPPRILLRNYRVSGSANLFLQDGYIDGTFFDVERFTLGGLRAYPILKSPKTLKIDVAISGEHYHGTAGALGTALTLSNGTAVTSDTNLTFSVNALVDVTVDTTYGENANTPATRGINMARIPPKRGQSFIIGE